MEILQINIGKALGTDYSFCGGLANLANLAALYVSTFAIPVLNDRIPHHRIGEEAVFRLTQSLSNIAIDCLKGCASLLPYFN